MPEIKFNSGLQTFKLNDAIEVSFNPTDIVFAEKIMNLFNELDDMQTACVKRFNDTEDAAEILTTAHELDDGMREKLDSLFNVPICAPLFGSTSVYAAADGLPLWCNLLLALIDTMDDSVAKEKKASNPRIQKYVAKYKRR